jgi:hypothetical protein
VVSRPHYFFDIRAKDANDDNPSIISNHDENETAAVRNSYSWWCKVVLCELSLDPEVAILFGREIGQSNGVFYLLVMNLQG